MNAQKIQLHPGRVDESQGSRPLSPILRRRFLPGVTDAQRSILRQADAVRPLRVAPLVGAVI